MTKVGPRQAPIEKKSFLKGLIALLGATFALFWFRPDGSVSVSVLQTQPLTRVESVDFSPDGQSVVLAVSQSYIRNRRGNGGIQLSGQAQIWDVAKGLLRRSYDCQKSIGGYVDGYIGSARFSPDGKWLSIGDEIRDLQVGRRTVPFRGDSRQKDLLFWPDKRTIFDVADIEKGFWQSGNSKPRSSLRELNFSADGRYLVTVNNQGEVLLWDVKRKSLAYVLARVGTVGALGAGFHKVVFSPDGQTVAATHGSEIILWNTQDGKRIARWAGSKDVSMFGLAFSPDGKTLASGGPHFPGRRWTNFLNPFSRSSRSSSTRGQLDLWEVPSGRLKSTLSGGTWILQVAFSPDGKRIATVGEDNSALLWEVPQ